MFVATKSSLLYSFASTEPYDKLTKSAAKIAIHNFEWSYTTLLLFNSTVVSGVDLFLRLYKKTQIIGKGVFFPPFAQTTRQYILFGIDILNIDQMLHWMDSHQFDNTGKYIITCQSQACDENEAVDVFWNHKIINVVFLKLSNDGDVTSYTYFYPDRNCRNSKAERTKMCTNDKNNCDGMFPLKLYNLGNCTIIVSTFNQMPYMNITDGKPRGADGDLLLMIAEKLNASLKMMTPSIGDGWGKLEENGTWVGSLADLLGDLANFSMTSAALTISRFSYFQLSFGYHTANVAWITRSAQVKPASLKLFYPFETLSQIVLSVSFILVGLCAWFANSRYWPFYRKSRTVNETKPRDSVFFYTWMICMGLPSTKLPTTPAFLYLAMFWVWYCFLIRTFYQVCLISSLQGNFYYDQLDTIEEAYENNYSFGGGLALRDYFIDYPLVYDNWITLNTTDIIPTLINTSKFSKNFVIAMSLETAKTVIRKNSLSVRILPQRVVNSPTVLFFKKFSPLTDSLNIILRRLTESGFTQKIHKKYVTKPKPDLGDNRTPITLDHYTGCYVILITGWIVSSILFVFELFYSKFKLKKRNQNDRRKFPHVSSKDKIRRR